MFQLLRLRSVEWEHTLRIWRSDCRVFFQNTFHYTRGYDKQHYEIRTGYFGYVSSFGATFCDFALGLMNFVVIRWEIYCMVIKFYPVNKQSGVKHQTSGYE